MKFILTHCEIPHHQTTLETPEDVYEHIVQEIYGCRNEIPGFIHIEAVNAQMWCMNASANEEYEGAHYNIYTTNNPGLYID